MVASMNFNPTLSKTVIRRTTNLMTEQTKLPEFVSALNNSPKCAFVEEELQIVPPGTELPPEGIR
ncbi:hypothetical protein pdam_00022728 [Pocillopora damicornis]|uniref:Uncharacterized protein n=1 Tax=Pocillopora damicornis TaxID=46731 RepID=A0A3M6U9L1_POCDA|nr:hypothetical protein pdam_00022728 [Pocillopora damicornis]